MIIVLIGVSGSGKTSLGIALSKELNWPFLEGDEFHPVENIRKMSSGQALTDTDRLPWLESIADKVRYLKQENQNAIIACSALKRSYREMLSAADRKIKFVFLNGEKELIAERLNNRKGHFMPPKLLESQLEALEEPFDDEAIRIDITAPIDQNVDKIIKLINK